jgi:S1-C subfamily serine protease
VIYPQWKWLVAVLSSFLFLTLSSRAQTTTQLEKQILKTARNVEYAVMPMMYWGPHADNGSDAGVVGSGFLINDEGYFITAAHVLSVYVPNSGQLTATRRSRNGDGAGLWFDVIEKDEQHDLALCKLKGFVAHFPKSILAQLQKGSEQPFASLAVSAEKPETGRFILIAGFPLGSWNPAVQLGTVAATQTVNPNIPGVPAGRRELLQISVSGNKGNSGCPVIDLRSGRVIGVIIQEMVSPLYSSVQGPLPFGQSSGIMLAAPAHWIQELLERHQVKSAFHPTTD